jgi:hypothetical protein
MPNASSEGINAMSQTSLDYKEAFRYAAAWASFEHDNVTDLSRNAHEFHGTLGSLEFQYSEQDRVLHVWSFIMPGAGPFVTNRPEIKTTLDRIAQQQPAETAESVFDVRTLDWHKQAGPELDPCLYLRLDIFDGATPVNQMVKKLDHLSTTGYVWHRQKMLEVLRAYWMAHPKPTK